MAGRIVWVVLLIASREVMAAPVPVRALSIEERAAAREAIERVQASHRIWPPENRTPKPAFEQLIPPGAIEARVRDDLRKGAALELLWRRPITTEQLQAEMDRMARDTKDATTLRELFAALGDDPDLIAECLARPILTERLLRNWYAFDRRFHVQAWSRAMRAHRELTKESFRDYPEGELSTIIYVAHADDAWGNRVLPTPGGPLRRDVSVKELTRLRADLGPADGEIRLREQEESIQLVLVLRDEQSELELLSRSYSKEPMADWWERVRGSFPDAPVRTRGSVSLPRLLATCDEWMSANGLSGPPDARTQHVAVWTGSEMIVWGGDAPGGLLNTGGRYDPATDTWALTSSGGACPTKRRLATAVWTGTEMIVWGGVGAIGAETTGGRYDPATDTWTATSTAGACPSARSGHTALWTGNEMIVWGGVNSTGVLQSGGRYDPAADAWAATAIGAACPAPRDRHTSVWTGTEMIVWGGDEGAGTLNTGGRYSPSADTWAATSVGVSCPTPRRWHSAVWTGSDMIIWGGSNGIGYEGTGGRYSPGTDVWAPVSSGPPCPSARVGHTAVWTGSEMIVWGGYDGSYVNTGGRYEPPTDTWNATTTGGLCPSARASHVAVWTGAEMIVRGGVASVANLSTGGRYTPALNAWVSTSTGGACPAARNGHKAVWTGTEMILWGGYGTTGVLATGGRYLPATDTWMGTSTGGDCPSPRTNHTAVWSGREMIVWGGLDGGGTLLRTGGGYDPTSDAWIPTSTGAGSPSARDWHTAVWTGSEMIVWGGYDNWGYRGDGSRYDPTMDAWIPTATMGAPSPRGGHSAIWTGSEMIVWGGTDIISAVSTGGRYAPAKDAWVATATGGACPAPRTDHTAVWTGVEMIVWGGLVSGLTAKTGGRYSPSPDTWMTTSTGGACPLARCGHTAVWTGDEMIVWGGRSSGYPTSGGRYAPPADTWIPTSTAGACPSGRYLHTAVWTGAEMIVWGGYPTTATGGRYRYISVMPAVLPPGEVGVVYGQTLTASGGTAPYSFTVTTGTLPPGLALAAGGALAGTPTQAGSYPFDVTATDLNGCTGMRSYVLLITVACGAIIIDPPTLPGGAEGLPYGQQLAATGGNAPYMYAVTAGTLPGGLTLSPSGWLGGTPSGAGTASLVVTATDAMGCTGERNYTLPIDAATDYLVGEGLGPTNGNMVRVYRRDGTASGVGFQAYGAGKWGTIVSSGDMDGAAYEEILTGPGPGGTYGPHVRGFERNGVPMAKVSYYAYSTLKYGVNVASGDLDGDGVGEVISGSGPGAMFGPHVRGWNFDGTRLGAIPKISFYAYGTLRWGTNVEEGDVDADSFTEMLVGPGPGPSFGAQVRAFDYDNTTTTAIAKVNYFALSYLYGVNVAGGDVDGDGFAEVSAAAGPGSGNPSDFVAHDYDGIAVVALPGYRITPFVTLYGGRVGLADLLHDGRWDLLAGTGRDVNAGSVTLAFGYQAGTLAPVPGSGFVPFSTPGYAYGVNVGGGGLGE